MQNNALGLTAESNQASQRINHKKDGLIALLGGFAVEIYSNHHTLFELNVC